MNVERTNESEKETPQHVCLDIPPPQLIRYLQDLDQRLSEDRNRGIREQFRNIQCFQHILGSSTSFTLQYDKPFFAKTKTFISSLNWGSSPIKVYTTSVPNTFAMSFNSEKEPPFLSYVSELDEVTIFCPELQEPIGRIERRKTENEADIICLATDEKFTIKDIHSDTPASMNIVNTQGRVVGAATVRKWKEITKYSKSTYLKQFIFRVNNGLSEATKIMFLVSFATWAKWANDKVSSQNRWKKIVGFSIAVVILLIVLIHAFYFTRY